MWPDFLNNTGQNKLTRSLPSPLAQTVLTLGNSSSVEGRRMSRMLFAARGFARACWLLLQPVQPWAQGTSQLWAQRKLCTVSCYSAIKALGAISGAHSWGLEPPSVPSPWQGSSSSLEKPGCSILQCQALKWECRTSTELPEGFPNSLITALEPWIAAASGQESRLCHSLVTYTAPQLCLWQDENTSKLFGVGLASLKGFQCSFHVSGFASSHHQILLQQVKLIWKIKCWGIKLWHGPVRNPGWAAWSDPSSQENPGRQGLGTTAPQVPLKEMPWAVSHSTGWVCRQLLPVPTISGIQEHTAHSIQTNKIEIRRDTQKSQDHIIIY